MSSQSRMREREESRRVSARTLLIASAGSFVAAVVTSRISTVGTPIAAALTPVIVALVSEMLHRPTDVIVQRVTTTSRPPPLADAAGAGAPPPPDADPLPDRAPAEPGSEPEPPARRAAEPVKIYRQGRSRRKVAVGVVAVTALLAFAIAAAALTVPELITGQSLGKGDNKTSLFGGPKRKKKAPAPAAPQGAPTEETTTTTVPAPQETTTTPPETAPPATTTPQR